MSTKVKKCKICGTTDAAEFAPRKSVICKNCDKPTTQVVVPEVVSETILPDSTEFTGIIEVKDNEGLKSLISSLEETVKQLQEDIQKLNKLKKLFPRIFPEDNSQNS
jgi:hypothetical protein